MGYTPYRPTGSLFYEGVLIKMGSSAHSPWLYTVCSIAHCDVIDWHLWCHQHCFVWLIALREHNYKGTLKCSPLNPAPGDVSGVCRQANWSGVLCLASERYLHEKANPLLIAEINWMPTSRHLLNAIGVLPIRFIWFIASMVVADGWSKIICNHHDDVVLNMYSYTYPANFESRSHWRTSASGLLKQFVLCKLQRKSSMLPRPPTAWVLSRCGHKTPWWSDT